MLLLWILVALEDLRPGLTPVSSGGWRPWWWLALPVAKALEASASVLPASVHMPMEGSQGGIDTSRTTAGRERACVSTPAHFTMQMQRICMLAAVADDCDSSVDLLLNTQLGDKEEPQVERGIACYLRASCGSFCSGRRHTRW